MTDAFFIILQEILEYVNYKCQILIYLMRLTVTSSCKIYAMEEGERTVIYDFGLRLKELRETRRLSQSEVAERLNVTRSTVSGYECNTITPSLEQLVKLALLYNTSLDYIMGMDNRSFFYLDELSKSQQKTVLDIVNRLKQEFLENC